MRAGSMEALIGANSNMKMAATPMRVFKEAERKGDTDTMERALGYAGDFSDKAKEYSKEAGKELQQELREERKEQESQNKKIQSLKQELDGLSRKDELTKEEQQKKQKIERELENLQEGKGQNVDEYL